MHAYHSFLLDSSAHILLSFLMITPILQLTISLIHHVKMMLERHTISIYVATYVVCVCVCVCVDHYFVLNGLHTRSCKFLCTQAVMQFFFDVSSSL